METILFLRMKKNNEVLILKLLILEKIEKFQEFLVKVLLMLCFIVFRDVEKFRLIIKK